MVATMGSQPNKMTKDLSVQKKTNSAYIALGSNLSNPINQVRMAFVALKGINKTTVLAQSSLFRTAPVGYDANQLEQIPDFINAVAKVSTELTPLALLDAILSIENSFGRERPFANAPRILDLDLLLYDDEVMQSEKLTLPHPRMFERGFVLLPLAEIAPNLMIKNHGKVADLVQKCTNQGVEKIKELTN